MSRLLRLYPARWRERYGAELLDAIGSRPLTAHDRVDLVRAALDARLHPELVGSRVPVLAGPGGDLPRTRSQLPTTLSLAVTATAAFLMVAVGLVVQDRWSAAPLWCAATVLGTTALGGVIWRSVPSSAAGMTWLVRVGAFVMLLCLPLVAAVAATGLVQGHDRINELVQVIAGWSGLQLAASIVLAVGSLISAGAALAPALSRRGHGSASGVPLLVLAIGLIVSLYLGFTRGISLLLAVYALMALGMGARGRPSGRVLALGISGGVMIAGLLALVSSVTSPWSSRDGYSLWCGADAVRCSRIADRLAAGIAPTATGRRITHMEISADGSAEACWTGASAAGNGCWYTTTDDRPTSP
jgi:hypothetical protein